MSKKVLTVYPLVQAGDMSADITSPATNIQFLDNVSLQANFTGTAPVGTFYIQGSLDHVEVNGDVKVAGNWVNLPMIPVPTAAGSDDSIVFDLNQLPFAWVRLFYDRTSGTGTLNAFISGKEI